MCENCIGFEISLSILFTTFFDISTLRLYELSFQALFPCTENKMSNNMITFLIKNKQKRV